MIAETLLLLFMPIAIATDCSTKSIQLIGAGSPFAASMYQEFGALYSANRSFDRNVNVVFDIGNSVYGLEKIETKSADNPILFAGSQVPLTADEKNKYPELLAFPTAAGALAIVFNIPKLSQINITISTLADIFVGKIRFWNHTSIQSVNPSVRMPVAEIGLVARADDGAGDTSIMTSALSAISDAWNKSYGTFVNPDFVGGECCNSTKWPQHIAFYGNRVTGMIGVVASIPYTMGYVSWPNTLGTGVTVVTIINSYGSRVEPNNIESVRSAMDYFLNAKSADAADGLEYEISNAKSQLAYPFASFSYMIINRTTHPNISSCQMQELTGFVSWMFNPAISGSVSKFGLVPLSSKVTDFIIQSVLPRITYQGTSVYNEFLKSLIHPDDKNIQNFPIMAVVGCIALITVVALGVITYVRYYRKCTLNDSLWMLADIKFVRQEDFLRSKLHPTFSISNSSTSTMNSETKSFFLEGLCAKTESPVFLTLVDFKRGSNWSSKMKLIFNKFSKEINHENVLQFLGVTVIDTNVYFVNQHSFMKGTLHHVLKTCPFQINEDIKMNIACDILEGMRYLHQKSIFHGTLNSLNCYMDVAWCVKIAHWELGASYFVDQNELYRTEFCIKVNECETSLESMETLIQLLYLDPEYFLNDKPVFFMDIFSYGLLLVEIFTRQLPYAQEVELELNSYVDIIRDKFKSKHFLPPMNLADIPLKVLDLIHSTLTLSPSRQMDMNTLHKSMKQLVGHKAGVVDILMQTMESYMSELEEKVNDRTMELSTVTDKMKDLLHDVLPKQIATKLISGKSVTPEYYECCTILFSDVVGFTTMAAISTPTEVMNFLNSLFTVFDQTLELYDVYKVDTIGDAYMAASGLPRRNGIDHCKHIGNLALALMEEGKLFQIPHVPTDKLKLRMGIHSGPLTTGIIGHKMPQFCVFGDTVNTASKLKAASLPNKIQVSETTQKIFENYFHEFSLTMRGEIEIIGKGKMTTYWLLSCSSPLEHEKT